MSGALAQGDHGWDNTAKQRLEKSRLKVNKMGQPVQSTGTIATFHYIKLHMPEMVVAKNERKKKEKKHSQTKILTSTWCVDMYEGICKSKTICTILVWLLETKGIACEPFLLSNAFCLCGLCLASMLAKILSCWWLARPFLSISHPCHQEAYSVKGMTT